MNSPIKMNFAKSIFFLSILFFSFSNAYSYTDDKPDKTTQKAREAVANTDGNNWLVLAESADKCIKKCVNLTEANKWINQSLKIKETSYNLEIKGDYYVERKVTTMAVKYYLKAMEVGAKEDDFDPSSIQDKLAKIQNK